jgi:hypothetical protein
MYMLLSCPVRVSRANLMHLSNSSAVVGQLSLRKLHISLIDSNQVSVEKTLLKTAPNVPLTPLWSFIVVCGSSFPKEKFRQLSHTNRASLAIVACYAAVLTQLTED